jgi:hypothetical protein
VSLGSCGHGSGFHIHGAASVGLCQLGFLLYSRHCHKGDERAFSARELSTASIARIKDLRRREEIAYAELRIKGPGETYRLHEHGTI